MVEHISTKFIGPITGGNRTDLPLHSAKADFEGVNFWDPEPWHAVRKPSSPLSFDAPVFSIWMEDEFGRPIPEAVRSNLREDANSYWTDMYKEGEIPVNWVDLGYARKEDFRNTMEDKYQWLRLCDGNWKTRQLWINTLKQWKKKILPKVSFPYKLHTNHRSCTDRRSCSPGRHRNPVLL